MRHQKVPEKAASEPCPLRLAEMAESTEMAVACAVKNGSPALVVATELDDNNENR